MVRVIGGIATSAPSRDGAACCPLCFSNQASFFARCRDRLFDYAPGTFELYRCGSCKSIFQFPLPEAATLQRLYPEGYWWADEGSSASATTRIVSRLERVYRDFVNQEHVRFLIRAAGNPRSSSARGSLLDIGCGTGTFLHLARRAGFASHGLEISHQAAQMAREYYQLDVRQGGIGSDVWKSCSFDAITLFHVLEHLVDPAEALRFAASLLRPNGVLIVQVPNVDSYQCRVFGSRWYGLDVPRHIINFNPESLLLLLNRSGFEIDRIAHFSLRDNPAAIASSLIPQMDPIRLRARARPMSGAPRMILSLAYLALFALALPLAFLESMLKHGGTILVSARAARN